MADFEIKEPREFSTSIRKHERTDHANPNLFNAIYEVLINNDAFLYGLIEALSTRLAEELSGVVPITRTVNNKPLSSDISLTASDVSAIPVNTKGAAGGVAELDSSGKVLAAQLPSFVDDVVDGYLSGGKFYKEADHTTVITGEAGKIYVDLHTSKTYRWSGTAFAVISDTIALGETSSTAYRGDRGKTAYDHSQAAHAPANAEQNVQSDWNVSDTASDAYIKNKPTVGNGKVIIKQAGTQKGSFTMNQTGDTTIELTDNNTTYSNMTAATASAAGKAGLAPAPAAGGQVKYLRGDGTWQALINGLTATAAGFALDARQGKALNDKITALKNGVSIQQTYGETLTIPHVLGLAHGFFILNTTDVYILRLTGSEGAYSLQKTQIYSASSVMRVSFTLNATTGVITCTSAFGNATMTFAGVH